MVEMSSPVSRTITECLRLYSSQGEKWKPLPKVEMEQSVRKALKTSRRATVRAATQLWDDAEREHLCPFGFSRQCLRVQLCFPDSCVLWKAASPKCYFPTQNQSKFTLYHESCEKIFETSSTLQHFTLNLNKACFKFLFYYFRTTFLEKIKSRSQSKDGI